jgi:hypothetical protein
MIKKKKWKTANLSLKKEFYLFHRRTIGTWRKNSRFCRRFCLTKTQRPKSPVCYYFNHKNFHSFPFSFTSLTEMTRICKTKVAAQILDLFKVVENEHLAHISLIEYSKWVSENLILLENAVKAQIYFYF